MTELRLSIDGPHTDDYTRKVAGGLAECVRVLNHATQSRNGVVYPSTIYSLLGDVHAAVFGLGQLLGQLDASLVAQREGGLLYDSRGLDPATSVAYARQAMVEARRPTVGGGPQLDEPAEADYRTEQADDTPEENA